MVYSQIQYLFGIFCHCPRLYINKDSVVVGGAKSTEIPERSFQMNITGESV